VKFRILVEHEDKSSSPWWEDYNKPINDPTQWGKNIIDWFNRTCHPREKRRRFIRAEKITEQAGAAEPQKDATP